MLKIVKKNVKSFSSFDIHQSIPFMTMFAFTMSVFKFVNYLSPVMFELGFSHCILSYLPIMK